MTATKQEKEKIIKDLGKNLKEAKIIIFVNFHGLNVALASNLRKLLRGLGIKYFVAKKTLVKKALAARNFQGEMPKLEGEVSLAFSEGEPIEPARMLAQFAKKNKVLKLIGGIFENKYIGPEKVAALASIPRREILLAQLVNIINSPIQGIVVALDKIASKKA